jgi:RNA polymerase sigma-70 factor (ECF subfamily)
MEPSDEELVKRLAAGDADALGPLHGRYAPIVFSLAARSLGPTGAEEVVQEVFVALWKKAGTFDPARGPFRPWFLRIAHLRILNELRHRRRHPEGAEPTLDEAGDATPEPDQLVWEEYRRVAIQRAVDSLPPAQRQVLRLAFFEELSHTQVADFLGLPLGTAKTRIRAALQRLQARLAPLLAMLALAAVALLGLRTLRLSTSFRLDERALRMVTSSDTELLRMVAQPGVAEAVHGTYRGRAGSGLAVVTLSNFPPAAAGKFYQAWALQGGRWTSLGTARPNAEGKALLIAEDPALAQRPEGLEVTIESALGAPQPSGEPLIAWRPAPVP